MDLLLELLTNKNLIWGDILMRKTVFLLMIIIIFLSNSIQSSANDDWKNITRGDCLSYIMLAIGTPGSGYSYNAVAEYQEDPYCDFQIEENWQETLIEYDKRSLFTYAPDLVSVAICYTDVVYGIGTIEKYNNKMYFGYIQYITLEEVLAFMVRCLKNDNDCNLADLKITTEIAKEKGLLRKEDIFYHNPNYIITISDFKVLLSRFISQKAHLCFKGPWYSEYMYSNDNITYGKYLSSTYGIDYLQKILQVNGLRNWNYNK